MSNLGYLAVVLIIPVSGLIIAAIMLRIVDRDAACEDRRTVAGE